MWIVLVLIAGALLATGLLAIPFDLRFAVARHEQIVATLRWEWLFGRIGREIERTPGGPKKRSSGRPKADKLVELLREPMRWRLETFLRRSLRWLSIEELRGRVRFGLGDPADTGMALGVLNPLLAGLAIHPRIDLVVEPEFEGEALQGDLSGSLRAVPLGLLAALIAFAASPETLRTLREMRPRPK